MSEKSPTPRYQAARKAFRESRDVEELFEAFEKIETELTAIQSAHDAMKETNAVLQSQVDNADINLEQVTKERDEGIALAAEFWAISQGAFQERAAAALNELERLKGESNVR